MNSNCCSNSNLQTPRVVIRKMEPASLINPEAVKEEENIDVDSLDIVGAVQHGAVNRVVTLLDSGQSHNTSNHSPIPSSYIPSSKEGINCFHKSIVLLIITSA